MSTLGVSGRRALWRHWGLTLAVPAGLTCGAAIYCSRHCDDVDTVHSSAAPAAAGKYAWIDVHKFGGEYHALTTRSHPCILFLIPQPNSDRSFSQSNCLSSSVSSSPLSLRGATTAEKLREAKVCIPTPGRYRPAPGRGWAGGECGRGSPPPAGGPDTPGNFFENSDAKSCILVASALMGSRGRVYPSKVGAPIHCWSPT